jgi:F-type H+-transporting ATPase subunit epsilon
MNYFTVDILTPSKIVAKDIPAESLLVPTVKGQINVLAQHTHIVSKLETGLISVFGGADDADRFFTVSTGVCKVLDNKITILAGTSEEKQEIDQVRAEEALKNAEEVLNTQALSDEDYQKWQRKKERAQLRIQLSQFKG